MFDDLLQVVKEHASGILGSNSEIPQEQHEDIMNTASSGIMDHLKGLMAGGGIDKIKEMFSSGDVANHPDVASMTSNIAGQIAEKFGISQEQATETVSKIVPNVMSSVAEKTNSGEAGGFNIQSMLGSLGGGASEGLGNVMNKISGLFGK